MVQVFSPKWLFSNLLYVVFSHAGILDYVIKSDMVSEARILFRKDPYLHICNVFSSDSFITFF